MGLTGLAIMAAAITATLTTVNANTSDSDLLSQNLEALTRNEEGGNNRAYWSNMSGTYVCCGPGNVRPDCGGTPDC